MALFGRAPETGAMQQFDRCAFAQAQLAQPLAVGIGDGGPVDAVDIGRNVPGKGSETQV